MLKELITDKINGVNNKLDITKYFASKNFLIALAITISIIATLLINLGANIVDGMISMINGSDFSLSLTTLLKVNFKYIYVYLIIYIICLFAYVKFAINIRASYKDMRNGQKGSDRFATIDEIKEQYVSIPDKELEFEGGGGIPICRDGNRIFIDDSNVNNLIIGITRSGKGEFYVLPMIDIYSRAKLKPSLVFNDPKAELARLSYNMLIERGYDVKVINLLDLYNTSCYNPLQLIIDAYKNDDLGEAQILCKTFTFSIYHNPKSKEPVFENSAMSLVNGLILALCEKFLTKNKDLENLSNEGLKRIKENERKVTLYTVACFLSDLGSENTPAGNSLDLYFNSLPKDSIAKKQYATSKFSEGKTRSSIFTVAMQKLEVFTLEKVAKFTAKNDINLHDIGFGDRPVAVFLIAPDYDKSLHPLNSIFINQMYYVLAKEASFTVEGKCKRRVKIILDEAGNMIAIDNIQTMMTVCLGRGIEITWIIQAYHQLEELYGKGIAQVIEDNCGNQIYLKTGSEETSEKFSKLVGNETIILKSRSGGFLSLDKNQTESLDRRRLLESTELRRLKEGEVVIVRTMKRKDLKGNKIDEYPIYTKGKYSLKHRFKYLEGQFAEGMSIKDIKIGDSHKNIKLDEISINLDDEMADILHNNYVKRIEEELKYNAIAVEIQKRMAADKEKDKVKASGDIGVIYRSRLDKEIILKLKSDKSIRGAVSNDDINKLDYIENLDELKTWINEVVVGKDYLQKPIEKLLKEGGYI